ncbi:MAG: glutathione S-transferase N-terminal domain-containing protein [Myxococcales bacterium]|nr:glutathione S-transferase N-terminal domain-containing protein [Myxococcales bacterium]
MKLFGNPLSTCTRKVLCTLHETGTPFEFLNVDLGAGEHKQPAHLARQPFGQVPAIDDDGFALYESRAICRYLDERAGGALVPHTAQGRAVMEHWISVETSNFTPSAMKLIYNYVFFPMRGQAQDPQMISDGNAGITRALAVLDARLAQSPSLAGDAFTLADVGFLPYIEYLMATPAKELFVPHAHVMAWWQRCAERASWRKAAGRA